VDHRHILLFVGILQEWVKATNLGIGAVPIPISTKPADLDEAFATIVRERCKLYRSTRLQWSLRSGEM
jgi:hypothetical protein